MMQSPISVDLTPDNFQQILLEQSQTQLVLVDFWAHEVPECQAQFDAISQLMNEYGQQLIWARVNCATEQQIAMQFGVQALPTIALIKEGRPIDGLTGPQTFADIKELVSKHLPKVEDELLQQAQILIVNKQFIEAAPLIAQALTIDPQRVDIQKANIEILLNMGRITEAESLLTEIKMIDQDDYYQSLMAQLELKKQAADTPEIKALQAELAADPKNEALVVKLAVQLHQVQRSEEALEGVFNVLKVKLDAADGEAKRIFMDIIQTLPAGDALAAQYRRRLYGLLY